MREEKRELKWNVTNEEQGGYVYSIDVGGIPVSVLVTGNFKQKFLTGGPTEALNELFVALAKQPKGEEGDLVTNGRENPFPIHINKDERRYVSVRYCGPESPHWCLTLLEPIVSQRQE